MKGDVCGCVCAERVAVEGEIEGQQPSLSEVPAQRQAVSVEALQATLREAPASNWLVRRAFSATVQRIGAHAALQSLGKDDKFHLFLLIAFQYAHHSAPL